MTTRREFLAQAMTMSVAASAFGSATLGSAQARAGSLDAESKRRAELEIFLKIFPPSSPPESGRMNAFDKTWEDWVRRTGELPPDFDSMPSNPLLPDPLLLIEGQQEIPITSEALWKRQRTWIRAQMEQWVFGTMPPAPDNLRAIVTSIERQGTTTVRKVRLEFGPGHRAILHLELIVPDGPGPFPVFLTNHSRKLPWLYTAVRRGYIGCFYAAHDPIMDRGTDDSDAYIDIYPEYDFSCLARWAWSASRAVDYLLTIPEVNRTQIGLAGHSRHGKQALLAAAFDERIAAVIPSSGNTGECDPWRYTTDMFVNESLEKITADFPHWFHPRLRFFAGREDKLPVDQNMLMAMVAPRGLMMYAGYAEMEANPFGYEQAYRCVKPVYQLLGREQNLWLHLREGLHPTDTADVEQFMDFFDAIFGRAQHPKVEEFALGYTFEGWQQLANRPIDPHDYPQTSTGAFLTQPDGRPMQSAAQWAQRKAQIQQTISTMLGQAPPRVPFESYQSIADRTLQSFGYTEGWLTFLYKRPVDDDNVNPRLIADGVGVVGIPFSNGLLGELFYPAKPDANPASAKLPVVVWLHPFSYQTGWSAFSPWLPTQSAYERDFRPSFLDLLKRGFAVFAFDQAGFGARIHEARDFYRRYPQWSLLGNMVEDTQAAVASLATLQEIDASRIFLMGYALGGKVALLAAGFDERVRGVASVCGFDPLRLDGPGKGVEGIRQYSHLHGLLPRLGYFAGHEDRVPFDFDEVLATVAPRPALVVTPTLDRYTRLADAQRAIESSKQVYTLLGNPEALTVAAPVDINKFTARIQKIVFDWLERQA